MKGSAVAARILELVEQHGDLDVMLDAGGLLEIDEIDVDTEDNGIIIWPDYDGRVEKD